MGEVLMDISMAETYSSSAADNTHTAGMKNPDSLTLYYKEIFAHHHITQEQFKASMDWYSKHPEDLDSVYATVSSKMDKALEVENKKLKKPL
jgi:hypothetical protein